MQVGFLNAMKQISKDLGMLRALSEPLIHIITYTY